MKKVQYSLVVVGLCIASVVSAQQPEVGAKGRAQKAEPTPAAPATVDPPTGDLQPEAQSELRSPHTCAIYPITFYGGAALYQADHYQDDNCNPPYLAYLYGTYTYPQTCGVNCLPFSKEPKCDSLPFYGLAMPVAADYNHRMPREKPLKYSKEALTPDRIKYLCLTAINNQSCVYVRVFTYKINRVDLLSGAEPVDANFRETIHFAFECQDPAVIGVDTAQIPEITSQNRRALPDPQSSETTVYDVTFKYAGGTAEAHILTFLCGDPVLPWVQP